jgi:glycosyltransferase involved in cell wall biosynthesis
LYHKYHIEPFSDTPWRKSFSGGSDDHCGLFIGKTFTQITGKDMSPHKFLEAFRAKKSMPMGRHNNYHDFAFSLYKITYEFAKSRSTAFSSSLLYSISKVLFDGSTTGFRNKLFLKKMKITAKPEKKALILQIENLLKDFESMSNSSIEEKMDIMYEHTSLIVDELIGSFIKSFEKHMSEGNIAGTIQNLSSLLPAVFITIPFFTTINVLHESQELLDTINLKYNKHSRKKRKKYLWFTDTLTDLNGVSETIQKIGKLSFVNNIDVMIAACIPDNEITDNLPSNICQLPCFTTYTASFFNTYTLRIPSILHALKKLYAQQPDEIFISTPGPVGLLGLLLARLMHIPCKGIYHTDFTDYARTILDDPAITAMTREYVKWFYSQCNTIYVPTLEYISILENRGYSPEKMKKFLRAVDQNVFSPQKIQTDYLEQKYSIKSGINILYVGRISREKNINKLFTIYYQLKKQKEALNLILCGNGPLYGEYREKYKKDKRVCFLGRLDRNELPLLYTATDLLVFPSTTDTFGMAVLEAQACGLPAIVSDKGGPQEIIIDTVTGYTARHDSVNDWIEKINRIINSIELYPEQYLEMRFRACKMVESKYNWNNVLKNLFNYNDPIVFTPLSNNTKRTMPTEILV